MPRPVLAHLPGRLISGAFILNSGWEKWSADDERARQLHGTATAAYPFLTRIEPRSFVKLLAGSEIALGAALLVPVVPAAVAGAGLTWFAAGLLGLYARIPGMRNGLRPTPQGLPIAKDVWLLGIGAGLMLDRRRDRRGRPVAI